jgi:hypothetical protein
VCLENLCNLTELMWGIAINPVISGSPSAHPSGYMRLDEILTSHCVESCIRLSGSCNRTIKCHLRCPRWMAQLA